MRAAVVALVLVGLVGPAAASDGGALLIGGGGGLGEKIYSRFRDLAGGEHPRLVVIPTASGSVRPRDEIIALWRERGFSEVTVLHTRSRADASEEAFVQPLREAHAVWISGGAQRRLSDVYVGGPVERELKALVARGGVVGGSSAGAAIQSRVMIESGNPKPKIGQGFDLAAGVVIDQHFLARNRFNRLLAAMRRRSNVTGIGIDEGTAIEVHGPSAEVLGDSFVVVVTPQTDGTSFSVDTYSDGDRFRLDAVSKPADR